MLTNALTFIKIFSLVIKPFYRLNYDFKIFTEKRFECDVCHRSYSAKGNFIQHMKIHNDSKRFKCDICSKGFHRKSNLNIHYRIHTGEKPFACQICDRKFTVKCALVQHQATHSEIKSFKCSICPEGRFFKTKSQLINHMVFHYEPKFSCSHCDYKSHTKCNLKTHEKSHIRK